MFKQTIRSLSNRLLITSLASILVVGLVLTIAIELVVLDNNRQSLIEQQRSFTDLVANRIDQGLQDRIGYLYSLSNQLHDGDDLLSIEQIKSLLDKRLTIHDFFNNGLVVVDRHGIVIQDSPELPGRKGLDVNSRDYFQEVKRTQLPMITEPIMGRAALEPIFIIIHPIKNDQQQVIGYIFGTIRLKDDNLLINISKETIGDQGKLLVLDLNKDLVVASSQTDIAMQTISTLQQQHLLELLENQTFQGQVTVAEQEQVLFTATPMQTTPWIVVHSFPAEMILAPAKELFLQISIIMISLLFISGLITLWVIRRLVRPLKTSAEQISVMLADPSQVRPLTIQRHDEVGILVSAFNQLLEQQEIQANQLRFEKIKADSANKAKTEFLANMSHEIRTPLNAIIGLSELQLSDDLPEEYVQHNSQILLSGKLLLGVVNDLLDFSKIESGKMNTVSEPFRMETVIEQLSVLFSLQAKQKGLYLKMSLDSQLPSAFIGDQLRLTQVLTNLLSNAIKFTSEGVVELSVEESSRQLPYHRIKFSVKDTGVGISEEQQTELFQAFNQVDNSITRQHGGTGLGLVISQRLVQLMGGVGITLVSKQKEGSCFSFELKLKESTELSNDESHSNHKRYNQNYKSDKNTIQRVPNESFAKQQVLVVEDHPINQQMVQAQLEYMGLRVSLANNGAEGVEKVREGQFDLVLMDIQMPVMDGYEATRAIRQFNQDIPIIALTAAALVEDRQKALDVGMNDHLGKPFSSQQLFDLLKGWLKTQVVDEHLGDSQPVETEYEPDTTLPSTRNDRLATVLIVDDVSANIKILANLLKDEYIIQVANKGQKALEIARSKTPPDLILLDIMMPEMDGFEVCRALKNNVSTSRIPVIFISALDEVNDERQGLDVGAVDYITKPFHPDIVKARVRNHMNLKIKTDLLETMSHIDGLTQVANRRSFDTQLTKEILRSQRTGKPLGIIMLDIDFFKPYNDNYGHGKGDECLVKVAAELQKVVSRSGDLFARYGGEEFVALLPETDTNGVKIIAEKMRKAVDDLKIPHEFSSVADHITISLGVSVKLPAEDDFPNILKAADKSLYRAKHQGRNRVVCEQNEE